MPADVLLEVAAIAVLCRSGRRRFRRGALGVASNVLFGGMLVALLLAAGSFAVRHAATLSLTLTGGALFLAAFVVEVVLILRAGNLKLTSGELDAATSCSRWDLLAPGLIALAWGLAGLYRAMGG